MKSPRLTPAVIALAAVSLLMSAPPSAAQAQPPAKPQRSCFYASNINNYTVADSRTIYLRVGVADVYKLGLMSDCPELTFRTTNLSFTRSGVGSICSPIDLTIRYRQAGARRICPVADMRKLTPAEIAALPKRDRP
jgi:hypothetical protein